MLVNFSSELILSGQHCYVANLLLITLTNWFACCKKQACECREASDSVPVSCLSKALKTQGGINKKRCGWNWELLKQVTFICYMEWWGIHNRMEGLGDWASGSDQVVRGLQLLQNRRTLPRLLIILHQTPLRILVLTPLDKDRSMKFLRRLTLRQRHRADNILQLMSINPNPFKQ